MNKLLATALIAIASVTAYATTAAIVAPAPVQAAPLQDELDDARVNAILDARLHHKLVQVLDAKVRSRSLASR